MRKFEALNRDEVTAALMCSFKDIEDTLAKEVSCVGCRRSVESKLILTLFNLFVTSKKRIVQFSNSRFQSAAKRL